MLNLETVRKAHSIDSYLQSLQGLQSVADLAVLPAHPTHRKTGLSASTTLTAHNYKTPDERMLRGARHHISAIQARLRASLATLQPASAHDTSPAPHSSGMASAASAGSKMQALVYKGALHFTLGLACVR